MLLRVPRAQVTQLTLLACVCCILPARWNTQGTAARASQPKHSQLTERHRFAERPGCGRPGAPVNGLKKTEVRRAKHQADLDGPDVF